jgi:hypothetical protein
MLEYDGPGESSRFCFLQPCPGPGTMSLRDSMLGRTGIRPPPPLFGDLDGMGRGDIGRGGWGEVTRLSGGGGVGSGGLRHDVPRWTAMNDSVQFRHSPGLPCTAPCRAVPCHAPKLIDAETGGSGEAGGCDADGVTRPEDTSSGSVAGSGEGGDGQNAVSCYDMPRAALWHIALCCGELRFAARRIRCPIRLSRRGRLVKPVNPKPVMHGLPGPVIAPCPTSPHWAVYVLGTRVLMRPGWYRR